MKNLSVKRALVSVSDKSGLSVFGRFLADRGVEILSTGGTAEMLRGEGVPVVEVSEYTGSPEVMGGRVKSLHPRIHGGILARREPNHLKDLEKLGGAPIDLVVVNFYPFEKTVERGAGISEVIENIDIGGPSMVRSAAKNLEFVAVVCDPEDYARVMEELGSGGITPATRRELAAKVFERTSRYDGAIARYLSGIDVSAEGEPFRPEEAFPRFLPLYFSKAQELRYGENPGQKAAFYRDDDRYLGRFIQHQGKELSFNNLMDLNAAWSLICDLPKPSSAVIKHTNPCGAAVGTDALSAFRRARETDSLSAFGGIAVINVPCSVEAAEAVTETFFEIVAAPSFEPGALERFRAKKNLRVLALNDLDPFRGWDYKRVAGGLLVQTPDVFEGAEPRSVVSRRKPTDDESHALELAWKVCKHVKSNAVVFGDAAGTVGIGAGQMSRVDAVKLAAMKAYRDPAGCVAASDAFFPFPDGVEALAEAGVTAVIQPGGSIRDDQVIEAADRLNLSMVFTQTRHFRHG